MIAYWARSISLILFLILYVACQKSYTVPIATTATLRTPSTQTTNTIQSVPYHLNFSSSLNIAQFPSKDDARLVDISSVNPNIVIDIRYATSNNFMKRKVYPVARCALRASVARRLSQVQEDLEKQGLGLKVYDCYRPLSVQRLMWDILPDSRYVANPRTGSRHNRGAAVDLTLVDSNGNELEMPTEFDDFSEQAHRNYRGGSPESRKNRQILENAMKKHNFIPLPTEWWHFDAAGWQKFSLLNVPLEGIPQ